MDPILTIALMTGSLIFSDVRSNLIKLWNVKIGYDIRKNSFKTLAVSLSLLIILSPLIIVIFSFEIILFDNNGLITFHIFLLSQMFFCFSHWNILWLFCKSFTHKFLCLVYLPLFFSVLFLRKMFLSFVLSIITLEKLFIKGE